MASTQAASGYKPYELVHGTPMTIPSAIKEEMVTELELEPEHSEHLADHLLQRAEWMKRHAVIA